QAPAPAAERVAAAVETVAAPGEFRNAYRRQLLALSRRIRLLGPFAEELRERRRPPGEEEERALATLADALEKALELLKLGREGSRISLVFDRDRVMNIFQEVVAQLEQALLDFPYNELDISDEVREQTYERSCIEKWLASGHHTCPTTQQRMANTTLTANYVLRSLISQWCETNGIEAPKRSSQPNKPMPACSSSERANIDALLSKLCSPDPEEQRSAAAELRLLAKRNAHNRLCIAEAGAIPLLLSLLSSSDLRTQEHAVTALLNLSIHEDNKASIMSSGAVPSVVHVLKNGSMEARENAAATLFSLSVVDEYKVMIGGTGAIPALVVLLSEGSQRGKKDAAAALFNLCIYQGNKGRAIRAGLVPLIMGLVTNPTGALMDEAMAILSILSSHQEGKAAIGAAEPVPALVELLGSGSPRNRENAAAVMLHLCSGEQQLVHLARAHECGIMVPLRELALNGTERGKRKAVQLLERMSRFVVQQQEEQESNSRLQATVAQVFPQAPEQVQEREIPDQLESPASQYPTLL
uniref:RING-type E3 ubiquitin transferase n=1 Tax=Aegilops tauschii subsp. strangulata TaxID=200361 RepID=A0A453JX92_AEGTS